MAIDSNKIGSQIKRYRKEKEMSQEELAEAIGTVYRHVSNIELGYKLPGVEMLVAIANALGVSADDLLQDVLTHPSTQENREVNTILQDCNHDEREMLIRTMKFLKDLLSEFGI